MQGMPESKDINHGGPCFHRMDQSFRAVGPAGRPPGTCRTECLHFHRHRRQLVPVAPFPVGSAVGRREAANICACRYVGRRHVAGAVSKCGRPSRRWPVDKDLRRRTMTAPWRPSCVSRWTFWIQRRPVSFRRTVTLHFLGSIHLLLSYKQKKYHDKKKIYYGLRELSNGREKSEMSMFVGAFHQFIKCGDCGNCIDRPWRKRSMTTDAWKKY